MSLNLGSDPKREEIEQLVQKIIKVTSLPVEQTQDFSDAFKKYYGSEINISNLDIIKDNNR